MRPHWKFINACYCRDDQETGALQLEGLTHLVIAHKYLCLLGSCGFQPIKDKPSASAGEHSHNERNASDAQHICSPSLLNTPLPLHIYAAYFNAPSPGCDSVASCAGLAKMASQP